MAGKRKSLLSNVWKDVNNESLLAYRMKENDREAFRTKQVILLITALSYWHQKKAILMRGGGGPAGVRCHLC